jgi:hypothetical protein
VIDGTQPALAVIACGLVDRQGAQEPEGAWPSPATTTKPSAWPGYQNHRLLLRAIDKLCSDLVRAQARQAPDRRRYHVVRPRATRPPDLGGETVLRCGAYQVVVPGPDEVFIGVHDWFPSARTPGGA